MYRLGRVFICGLVALAPNLASAAGIEGWLHVTSSGVAVDRVVLDGVGMETGIDAAGYFRFEDLDPGDYPMTIHLSANGRSSTIKAPTMRVFDCSAPSPELAHAQVSDDCHSQVHIYL